VQLPPKPDNDAIVRDIESLAPELRVESVELEGESDFFRAYKVNYGGIFGFA
jgi:hypothetical protein